MYQSDAAPWLEFYAWNTDGSAKTDLVYNTSGISIVVVRDNLANSSALTLSAASGPTDWAAGKFHAMGGNKYRVGIATASISSFTGQISVEGTYTSGVLTGVTREVSAYNPTRNPAIAGEAMLITSGTGAGQLDVTSGVIKSNVTQFGGTNGTFASGVPEVKVASMAADSLTAAAISADAGAELAALVETYIVNEGDATAVMQAIADKIAADWVAGDASPLAIASAVWANATRTITGGSLTTSPPTAAAIADAVWDESRSGHTTDGTFGFYFDAAITSRLAPTVSGRTLNVSSGGAGDAALNAAARVKLAADQPDYAPATATALTAALTKIRKFFQLSLRKDAAISTDNATELAEINADGGTGVGGYLSTTDSQEAIRDNSGGGGGGSATAENQTTIIGHLTDIKGTGWSSATDTLKKIRDAISNLISTSVVVPGPVLNAVGMPETLEIGDSYEEESCLTIYIRDADDNPVSAAVGHDFTDGDFAPTFVIAPAPGSSRGRVKGIVTYVDPGGSDEPYLKVDIPSSQSKLAVAGEASVQLVLKWPGAEKTLLNTTVRWLPRI